MTAALKPTPAQLEYQLLDVVVTRVNVPNVSGRTVLAGTAGTIVEVFETPWVGYMIEFPDDEELSLPVLGPDQIGPRVLQPAGA